MEKLAGTVFMIFLAAAGVLFIGGLAKPVAVTPAAAPKVANPVDPLFAHVDFVQGSPLPGQPLLVEFWATWCGSCQEAIPKLNEISARYRKRGLQVVSLSQEEPEKLEAFAKRKGILYIVGTDRDGLVERQFQFQYQGTAFLVNSKGEKVWTGFAGDVPVAMVEKTLRGY